MINYAETLRANNSPPANGSVHEVFAYQNVSYHYLGDTRLARVSSSAAGVYELGYDALGRCARRTSNGVSTYYIYDGERPIVEFDAGGTITARNTYGIGMDEILARDSGTPLYYHQDRLGNVSAVTNGVGQVVEQYRYDAFGQPEIRGGPVPGNANGVLTGTVGNNVTQVNNRFLFTGREWVASYGFYEYRNRAYNPALGRFMSEDPKGFKAGDRNLYRYCGGDPVNRMDPMGLEEVDIDFRAFIPQATIGPFRGDNRNFSANANASSRTSVSMRIETDSTKNGGRVIVGQPSVRVSPTTVVGIGLQLTSKGPRLPTISATRDGNGNAVVNLQQNVRNPYQPIGGGIAANVNISVNQAATDASVSGSISRSPSFEANFTKANGASTNLPLQSASRKTGEFILGLGETSQIDKTTALNTTAPATATAVEPKNPSATDFMSLSDGYSPVVPRGAP